MPLAEFPDRATAETALVGIGARRYSELSPGEQDRMSTPTAEAQDRLVLRVPLGGKMSLRGTETFAARFREQLAALPAI